MTGADVVAQMLRTGPAVIALVPVPNIKSGRLPADAPLNALLVRTVTSIDAQPLKRGALVRRTDRVSVTVRAGSYRDQVAIVAAVRARVAGFTGDLGDVKRVSALPAGVGPDLDGPGNTFEQAQDFRVSFDAAA